MVDVGQLVFLNQHMHPNFEFDRHVLLNCLINLTAEVEVMILVPKLSNSQTVL